MNPSARHPRKPDSDTSGSRTSPHVADITFADTVITGGPILTMDAAGSRAEAVAVAGGRILAVGTASDLEGLTGPRTELVDLDGRALLPGLIDPHMHSAMVQLADWVDVSPMATPTADAVFATLREAQPTSTGWVLAKQFDPSITEGYPQLSASVLDRLVPSMPVVVLEGNGHIAYANTLALSLAGVTKDSPDPPAGRYVRDSSGELTGRLEEPSALAAFAAGAPFAVGEAFIEHLRDLLWHAASKGVTLLHDCGIGSVSGLADREALPSAVDESSPVRYRGMLVSNLYDTWVGAGLALGFGDDLLRVNGMKAWSDGSNQAGTGFQREPYLGSDSCGALHPEQIERMASLGVSPSFLIGHIRW